MTESIAPAARLAPQLAHNLLVNPGFEIWQRGTSAFTADDIFTADEWKIKRDASDTLQIDDDSSPYIGTLCLLATKTGTNDVAHVRQGLENYKQVEGMWLTFSAWVKTSTASFARLVLQDYVAAEESEYSDYHTGGGDWEQLTVVKKIRTGLASYASFPHSFGIAAGLQLAALAGNARIDGASLVVGEYRSGVDFLPLNPAEDQARCERFYQTDTYGREVGVSQTGQPPSGAGWRLADTVQFTTPMASTPTLGWSESLASDLTFLSMINASTKSFLLQYDSDGSGGSWDPTFRGTWTAEIT